MGNGFLPRTDAELLAWSLNFSTKITASPTAFGLTSAMATAYAGVHSAFATALAACDPGERNKVATATKNTARTALKTQARLLNDLVQGTATVTPAQKLELGLNVRATPTPVPPPADPPALDVLSTIGHTVSIRLHDLTDSSKRGMPVGVIGATVFSYVGETPPASTAGWHFEGNTGRTNMDIVFADSVAPGTKVWLTAFWFNRSKQGGPACTPVSAYIQFGGTMAA